MNKLKLALMVSLAVNLFAVGVLAAGIWHRGGIGPGGRLHADGPRGFEGPGLWRRALEGADEEAAEAVAARHRDGLRAIRREMAAAREATGMAMRADPFDRAALDEALARLRETDAARAQAVHAMMAEMLGAISAQGRAAVADRMQHRRRPQE